MTRIARLFLLALLMTSPLTAQIKQVNLAVEGMY